MTIKVYESIMPGEPSEVYDDHGMTVESWVAARAKGYQRGSVQPISCMINGTIVKPVDWDNTVIGERDVVEFRPVPFGDVRDALGFILPFWGGSVWAGQAVIDYITPDIPGIPDSSMGQQGSRISPADARANVARLGQGIPELFGRYISYPDYANQPHRYYKDQRTQVLRMMLSVGVGKFDIDPDTVSIGETPVNQLEGISYQIFEPGANVSSVANHENWYNVLGVGATQSSSGIRLKGINRGESMFNGTSNTSGSTISGIVVHESWSPGTEGSISFRQDVSVFDGDLDPDYMIGNFQHLEQGQTVTASDSIGLSLPDGDYVVSSLTEGKTKLSLETTGGAPVNLTNSSTPVSGFVKIDKAGTKYRITSINSTSSIDVERILSGGGVDPDWSVLPTLSFVMTPISWEEDTMTGYQAGPFAACPSGETTDTLEVDIFAPQGLGIIDGEDIDPRSRTIRIEWRSIGGTTWSRQEYAVSGATRDQLGWTITINLPSPIRPEVRISRVGVESTAITSLDRLELTALKSRLPTVTSYPGVTTMAITIENSDKIGRSSENRINLIPQRKLPAVAGGAEAPTRSIAAATAYVARSLGYGDDQINISELERLDGIWQARGDYFDYVLSDGTALDAMKMMLRAGFADVTLDNGIITPVRDEPRTQLEDGYSPENMTAPLRRQFTGKQPDEADGVEVEYTNADTWTTETVMCTLPGDQQIKVDKIKLDGVTDRTRAWRIGMRRRRAQRYRRWTYSFNTELDALNSQYLSYVPLLDDIPGYGKVAILTSISVDRITVSEPLEWEAGKTHVVAYRDENGDTIGPFPATQGPDAYTVMVSIPQPWPAVLPSDREQTHVYFGTTDRWSFPALITEISPNGPLEVGVTATNYDERVYADDNSTP